MGFRYNFSSQVNRVIAYSSTQSTPGPYHWTNWPIYDFDVAIGGEILKTAFDVGGDNPAYGYRTYSLDGKITPVPEPATLLGFGIPILMVGLGKIRQLRK